MAYRVASLLIILLLSGVFNAVSAHEVLLVLWQNETDAERGFIGKLSELHPEVKFQKIYAKRDKAVLARQLRKIDFNKISLVHSVNTTGTILVKKYLQSRTPMVFNLVSDPVRSKIVQSIHVPGDNTTGVRFIMYPENQLQILRKIKNVKSLAVWYDPREAHSLVMLEDIRNSLEKMGVKFVPVRLIPDSPSFSLMLADANKLSMKQDAIYIIACSSFYANRRQIFNSIDASQLVMSSLASYARAGSTVAVAADLFERGEAVADQASAILKGKRAGDIPVNLVTNDNAYLYVNKDKMKAVGSKSLDHLGINIKFVNQGSPR